MVSSYSQASYFELCRGPDLDGLSHYIRRSAQVGMFCCMPGFSNMRHPLTSSPSMGSLTSDCNKNTSDRRLLSHSSGVRCGRSSFRVFAVHARKCVQHGGTPVYDDVFAASAHSFCRSMKILRLEDSEVSGYVSLNQHLCHACCHPCRHMMSSIHTCRKKLRCEGLKELLCIA
jgi:hypothetical protein